MKERILKSAISAALAHNSKSVNVKKRFVKLANHLSESGDLSQESLDGLIFLIESYFDDSYNYKESDDEF